jgi:hypothetical protein
MTKLAKSLCTAALTALTAVAFSQAPVVRQPPSGAPQYPDQQQPSQYPDSSAPPQYPQPAPIPPQQAPPPPAMAPQQLEQLVNRIALYPDPLLAQTLTAATFWDQIPAAAAWADQHSYLHGDDLSAAITADNLPWDPSILALLPFPTVIDMMARDPAWTSQLGTVVLNQRQDVMDVVQHLRRQARDYGYLATNSNLDVVDDGGYIQIQPYNPYLYYIPIYSPAVVFFAPRPGFYIGGAIRFGPVITIGPSFGRFGWFGADFGWSSHAILIDHRPWTRTYVNRGAYVNPYAHPYVAPAAPRAEHHAPPPQHNNSNHH